MNFKIINKYITHDISWLLLNVIIVLNMNFIKFFVELTFQNI